MAVADFINDDNTVISDNELPCTGSFGFEAVRMFGPFFTVFVPLKAAAFIAVLLLGPLLTVFVLLKAATLALVVEEGWFGAVGVNAGGTFVRIVFLSRGRGIVSLWR